jgi:hypothetical protein
MDEDEAVFARLAEVAEDLGNIGYFSKAKDILGWLLERRLEAAQAPTIKEDGK